MAVNLQGWVTPENEMEGLQGLSNNLRRETAYNQRLQEQATQRKTANTKFVADYLDDKAKFTGTKYDPHTYELNSQALNKAMGLIKEGVDISDVMSTIDPLVNKINKYTLSAQQYSKNRDEALKQFSNVKGIDLGKFKEEMDRQAFEGKDISEVDPTVNYADLAMRNGDIFNEGGFDESFIKAPKSIEDATMVSTNARGGKERTKVKLEAPYYAISEKDTEGNHIGFVPKYQKATEFGNDIIHEWDTEHGKVKEPIRLYDKELFDAMSTPEKAYVRKEAEKYAKAKGADLSSPQMENFARALAYDLKKARIGGKYTHAEETKENPAPRISINVASGERAAQAAEDQSSFNTAMDEARTTEAGLKDVTDYLAGITLFTNGKGGTDWQADKIYFNPKTKNFTVMKDGTGEKLSFDAFKQRAKFKPGVSSSDIKSLRFYKEYNPKEKAAEDIPTLKSKAEFDALPKGAFYYRDGKKYQK